MKLLQRLQDYFHYKLGDEFNENRNKTICGYMRPHQGYDVGNIVCRVFIKRDVINMNEEFYEWYVDWIETAKRKKVNSRPKYPISPWNDEHSPQYSEMKTLSYEEWIYADWLIATTLIDYYFGPARQVLTTAAGHTFIESITMMVV